MIDMVPKLSELERSRQIGREARCTVLLYFAYFLWWLICGYGLGMAESLKGTYILGLPVWFFWSCVVGYVWFCVAAAFLVKTRFKDFDLGEEATDYE